MSRILVCIPFLVFFALLYPRSQPAAETHPEPEPFRGGDSEKDKPPSLPDPDVLGFIRKCLDRYDQEIKGYTGTLYKHERVQGKLKPAEILQFEFREKPHSVYMKWLQGASLATAVLYVEGQNDNKLLVLPFIPLFIKTEEPRGATAKSTARYTIDEFGIKIGLARVFNSWTKRRAANDLHVDYEGVFKVPEAGNRPCYKVHRSQFTQVED